MRFVVKGDATPWTVVSAFHQIADYLERAKIERMSGIEVYLTPYINNEASSLPDYDGKATETIEVCLPSLEPTKRPLPTTFLKNRPLQIREAISFIKFAESLGLPRCEISVLLGISEDHMALLESRRSNFEFDATAQQRLAVFCDMMFSLRQLIPRQDEMIAWFAGSHLHTQLIGDTPLEQLQNGGFLAAAEMTWAFDRLLRRKGFGIPIPMSEGSYYDLLPPI